MIFRRIFNWIVERLEAFFVLFLVLTVGIGLVWFLGAVVFPAQNRAMLRTPQIDQAAQMGVAELSFWTPEKVLRGDQPQDLVLIYAPEGPGGANSPFTLTLSTTSPYLFFIDPRNQQATTQLTLPLTATLPCTNTIGLVHTRTLPWWQAGSALVDVRLTGAPPPDGNPQEGAFPVELALEPGWQEALRGLSTQMAPTFLLALAGAVSSFFGLQLNQAEKRRKKAEKALGDFYQHLVKRDFPASQGAYQDMQKSKESLPAVDLERVEALFGLAEGDLGSENYTAIQALWEEKAAEAAGAMILAARRPGQHSNWNHELFGELLEKFPEDKIGDQSIKADFQRVKGDFDSAAPFQPLEWPPKPKAETAKVALPGKPNLTHPFPAEYAEKDKVTLFAEKDGVFWGKHPLFQELEKAGCGQSRPEPHFIQGAPGSGKTAFALGLGEYIFDQDGHIFGVYFQGRPERPQIAKQIAARLFAFVLSHPTFLTQLGPDQMALLAGLLCAHLGRLVVLSELERFSSRSLWSWLEDAEEDVKETWAQIASGQLSLLCQAVAAADPPVEEKTWLGAATACARSLGFNRLRLAFDLPPGPDLSWFQEVLLPQVDEWIGAGWKVLVFSPEEWTHPGEPTRWERHALTWEDDQIEAWARWRWDTLNRITTLEEYLTAAGLRKLVRRAGQNPRCYIRIWDELITSSKAGFKPKDIDAAGRRVKCF